MAINASESSLKDIPVQQIDRNPENPRVIFRPRELEDLLESIRKFGVQVPISLYKKANRYVLIDGERRWRCCVKLGKETIPALVQEEPDPLTNLLLMFNIHALREQWDLMTIALKLPRVIGMLAKNLQRSPNEREISEHTGLPRAIIRRCKLLMDLPDSYKEDILNELRKPKASQRLTEDFFIEMERALKTVERAFPLAIDNKDRIRRTLIKKFQSGVIKSRVTFRLLAKIARSERVNVSQQVAMRELGKVFAPNQYSIQQAYDTSVASAYAERDLATMIEGLIERLQGVSAKDLDADVIAQLRQLITAIRQVLGGR
jgi:ParB family chromosome partitioning protein